MIPLYHWYYTNVQGTGLAFIVMADVFTKVATTSQVKIESSVKGHSKATVDVASDLIS